MKPLFGYNVLVVDDATDNRLLAHRILIGFGAEADTACDGFEGIEKALTHQFDNILMDIQMPRLSGLEAATYLRNHNYRRPIIAFTAHTSFHADLLHKLQNGVFSGYVAKPIDFKHLIETIRAFPIFERI